MIADTIIIYNGTFIQSHLSTHLDIMFVYKHLTLNWIKFGLKSNRNKRQNEMLKPKTTKRQTKINLNLRMRERGRERNRDKHCELILYSFIQHQITLPFDIRFIRNLFLMNLSETKNRKLLLLKYTGEWHANENNDKIKRTHTHYENERNISRRGASRGRDE